MRSHYSGRLPGARVLDVAAAQGNFSLRLAEIGLSGDLERSASETRRLRAPEARIRRPDLPGGQRL